MEELNRKYLYLQGNLKNIKQELEEITNYCEVLLSTVKDNLLIDEKMYAYDDLESIKKNLNNILIEVRTDLIPKVNNNI